MKRIAYFAHTAEASGANKNLRGLLSELDRCEFEPVIYFPGDGPFVEELRAAGEHCRIADIGSSEKQYSAFVLDLLRVSQQLRECLQEDQIGLVHTNTCLIPQPAVAALRGGIPLVCHVRDKLRRNRLSDAYFGFVLQSADRVIAVSLAIRDDLLNRAGVTAARVDIIDDGFDLPTIRRQAELVQHVYRRALHTQLKGGRIA